MASAAVEVELAHDSQDRGGANSSPATPTFDRGLPTADLNNAAGADRSNVVWSFGNDYVTGDDFTIGATGEKWYVNAIRTGTSVEHRAQRLAICSATSRSTSAATPASRRSRAARPRTRL